MWQNMKENVQFPSKKCIQPAYVHQRSSALKLPENHPQKHFCSLFVHTGMIGAQLPLGVSELQALWVEIWLNLFIYQLVWLSAWMGSYKGT